MASISDSTLRRILVQYANVPNKDAVLAANELDEIRIYDTEAALLADLANVRVGNLAYAIDTEALHLRAASAFTSLGEVPDPFTPTDGTWNVVGNLSVRASGGATGSEQFGGGASATGTDSTAMGISSSASQPCSLAAGDSASASGHSSTAVGRDTDSSGGSAFSGGNGATAVGNNSVALGSFASSGQADSISIGNSSQVQGGHTRAMAFGANAMSSAANRATFGSVGTPFELEVTDNLLVASGVGVWGVTPPGAQPSKINDPSGGATVDAESRTAINAILDVLEGAGLAASA